MPCPSSLRVVQVYVTPDQLDRLDQEARRRSLIERRRVSRMEIMRRALDRELSPSSPDSKPGEGAS